MQFKEQFCDFFTWLYNFQEHRGKHVNKQRRRGETSSSWILTHHSRLHANILCWKSFGKRPESWDILLIGRNFLLFSNCSSGQRFQATSNDLVGRPQIVASFRCDINHSAIDWMLNIQKAKSSEFFFSSMDARLLQKILWARIKLWMWFGVLLVIWVLKWV